MATNDYGFFFNSNNGDRVYDADSFSTWLRKFFTSGVFEGELAVTAADGMTVEVGSGYANVDGKVRFFNSPQTIALSPANSTYPRIDTIVVERNDGDREITLKYITGQYSGNTPSPTERQWGNGVYQLVLAQIYVGAGVTSISQANIADTRPDSSLCGYVVGTVEEIDLSQILAQSQEQFAEWFDRMKGQLSEDAAGNLQLEIDSINDVLYDPTTGGTHLRSLTVDGTANIAHLSGRVVGSGRINSNGKTAISDDADGCILDDGVIILARGRGPGIDFYRDRETSATSQIRETADGTLTVRDDFAVSGTLTVGGFPVPAIQSGTINVNVSAVNSKYDFTVTFPKAFAEIPNIQLTVQHLGDTHRFYAAIKSRSTTGFIGTVWSTEGTGSPMIHWLATY